MGEVKQFDSQTIRHHFQIRQNKNFKFFGDYLQCFADCDVNTLNMVGSLMSHSQLSPLPAYFNCCIFDMYILSNNILHKFSS